MCACMYVNVGGGDYGLMLVVVVVDVTFVLVCVHVCVYVCICACMYVCMYMSMLLVVSIGGSGFGCCCDVW